MKVHIVPRNGDKPMVSPVSITLGPSKRQVYAASVLQHISALPYDGAW